MPEFTLEDFSEQIRKIKALGPMKDLLKMVPGMRSNIIDEAVGDGDVMKVEAIIQSMTRKERVRPEILNLSRRNRIARGSGTSGADVDDLLHQWRIMKDFMR